MANAKKVTKVESVKAADKVEKVNEVLANENIDQLREELKTKSAVIRQLASKGYSRSDIAGALNIRYQHVRNVLVQDAAKKAE